MEGGKNMRRSFASLVTAVLVLGVWPVQALAKALVRFVHAVPGTSAAHLQLSEQGRSTDLGQASFAQSTQYRSVRAGSFTWKLSSAGRVLAHGTATLKNATYTIVVLAKGAGAALGIYRDQGGRGGVSLLRMIHAAPELGSPDLQLDSRTVAHGVAFSQATPYGAVKPGSYELSAVKPGDSAPLVKGKVTLGAGDAVTALVVGSRGQRVRVVTVTDRGAPLTRTAAVGRRAAPRRSGAPETLKVRHGDSLWSIARSRLAGDASQARIDAEVQRLWNMNQGRIGTGDPNLILPGQTLRL